LIGRRLFNDTVSVSFTDYLALNDMNMIMFCELKWIKRELNAAYFKILYRHSPRGSN